MPDPFPRTSQQQICLLSLTDYMPGIWNDTNQVRLGLRKRINRISPIRSAYIWDMHRLANGLQKTSGGFGTVPNTAAWQPLFVGSFDDDTGSNIYSNLPTPFTTTPFTHQTSDKFVYSCNLNLSPMLPLETGASASIFGELLLWQAMVYPGMPFLVGSSILSTSHFGPVFAESISLQVSGSGDLSPVSCNVRLSGGRSIVSPPVSRDVFGGDAYSFAYRTATLMDCGIASEAIFDIESLRSSMTKNFDGADERFIGMNLQVTQTIKVTATCNNGIQSDKHGPRFVSIENRQVKGTIEFYSRNRRIDFPVRSNGSSSSLTMYFGGPFLFIMENVDWQQPKLSAKAGKGFVHTLDFIARAAPQALSLIIPGIDTGTASEFSIPSA